MTEKIRACFFDLGNTLNNDLLLTEKSVEAMGAWLKERGHYGAPKKFEETYNKIHQGIKTSFYSHTFGETEFFHRTFERLGISGISPEEALPVYRDFVVKHGSLDPRVQASLDFLRSRGIKCAILSNERTARVHSYLETTGILSRFDAVIVSEAVGVEKPHPEIFQHALQQLNIPLEQAASTLMFGDNSIADGACRQLGMIFVLVTGYKSHRWYFEQGRDFAPDYEIDFVTPENLQRLLDSIQR